MRGKKDTTRKPFTLAESRRVVTWWDEGQRAYEMDRAQTDYFDMLCWMDEHMTRFRKSLRTVPKSQRAKAIREEEAYARDLLRAARLRANRPPLPSSRVTGHDISETSRVKTVPGESRALAGIRYYPNTTVPSSRRRELATRSEGAILRSRGGRILATVIVAGAERELFARLLTALSWRGASW